MDARIYSVIRRDGITLYRLNIFASIFIVLVEILLTLILLISIKLNAGTEVLICLGILLIVTPIGFYKLYKRRFKYYKTVRLKDILYEFLKPSNSSCNHYHGRRIKIEKISISASRKKG